VTTNGDNILLTINKRRTLNGAGALYEVFDANSPCRKAVWDVKTPRFTDFVPEKPGIVQLSPCILAGGFVTSALSRAGVELVG
jgi:hypothetical protein